MLSRLFGIVVVVVFANQAPGFEVGAVIRKIDAEKRIAHVFTNGKERTVKVAEDLKVLNEDGKELPDGLSAKELKQGATVTLRVERDGSGMAIVSIRMGGIIRPAVRPDRPRGISVGRPSVGFKPLTEMTAEDRYRGEDGGLYGSGRNEPPESHNAAAERETKKVQPLDSEGNPAADGKIGLVSISMSNATQEFSRFKRLADGDPDKSAMVSIVDCAQGGQTMARWADPEAACWTEADRRLTASRVTSEQVQVAWVKLANAGPSGELEEHGEQLDRDTRAVLRNLKARCPNLRIAYLASRIYGGYADGRLPPPTGSSSKAISSSRSTACRWRWSIRVTFSVSSSMSRMVAMAR